MANFIDRWINRLDGAACSGPTGEKSFERIAANLLAALDENTKDAPVLFAGTADKKVIDRACGEIGKILSRKGVSCIAGGNVLEDAQTISLAGQCCGVVLVERQGKAVYPVLEQEITAFEDLKREILGFVLVQK